MPAGLRRLLLLVVFFTPPCVVRGLLWFERGLTPSLVDLRGIVLDLPVALLFLFLALWAARFSRYLSAFIAAIWLIVCVIGYEFASQFDAVGILNYVGYAFDPTFFFGSALRIRHPWQTYSLLAVVTGLTLVLCWRPPAVIKPRRPVAAALAAGLVLVLVPESPEFAEWRQNNVLLVNLSAIADLNVPHAMAIDPEAGADIAPSFAPDLSGRLEQPTSGGGNVLLIVLESVSGAYLPSLADDQGVFSDIAMPLLDARANRTIAFQNFVTHQRQTNRGEYAMLCGDYPKLASHTARMSEFASVATRLCLPRILRDAGYGTAYVQAAPLGFMTKDAFMANIGYEDILGYQWFDKAYSRTGWGVDDRAFFERSLDEIRKLDAAERPWFATLLTSGTHHPLNVPDDFAPQGLSTDEQRAFAWLDAAVENFIGTLEGEGMLDNTLVVITSDESAGITRGENARVRAMSQNWGFAILQTPNGDHRFVETPFAQSDIALSILDYVELADRAPHFVGRSMLRSYDTDRTIFFSNTYQKRSGALTASGLVIRCAETGERCEAWEKTGPNLFGPGTEIIDVPDALHEQLNAAIALSLGDSVDARDEQTFSLRLVEPDVYSVPPKAHFAVFGGQYLTIRKNTQMDVDMAFEVLPGAAVARIHHDIITPARVVAEFPEVELKGGDSEILHYQYDFSQFLPNLEVRLIVENTSDEPLLIRMNKAVMSLRDKVVENDKSTIVEHHIVRAAAP